jgi:hypothetical protein
VSATPLVPGPLYGLRTWVVVRDEDGERLAAPQRRVPWPDGGAWLEAGCEHAHAAPGRDCRCGIHAWHPSRRNARRVLAMRREIVGVVEADGAVEVHEEGFRAERARPHALVVTPGRHAALIARLGARYGAQVAAVRDADELVAWCRERNLGLEAPVVAELLGPEAIEQRRRARRERRRRGVLRVLASLVVTALLVVAGLQLEAATDDHPLFGRTGQVERR